MKKNLFFSMALATLLVSSAAFTSCKSDDNSVDPTIWGTDNGVTSANQLLFGDEIGNGEQEFVFTGKQTLAKGTYILKGWVYIANGAELTIEPGTIIKGDKQTKAALIVERGGKLIAQGTASEPIVFTSEEATGSRKPGDWGGVILCGKARNNQEEMQIEGGPRTKHGGNDDSDNSGILSYVRIEFAGYPFATDKEINGLTLGSVGNGTQIDHVQVSYCNDDSFEWFGGSVNCKYLVAYRGWDDEFDTDNGFSGKVQFALSIRDSKIADTSQSNGFESDNCADGSQVAPYTTATFSNVTFVGPMAVDAAAENTTSYINGGSVYPNNGSSLGRFQAAMHLRRSSHLHCFNSVALGWPIGLIIDSEKGNAQASATDGSGIQLENIYMAGMTILGSDANKVYKDSLYDYSAKKCTEEVSFSHRFFAGIESNKTYADNADLKLDAQWMPLAGSPLLNGASFSNSLVATGFDKVSYAGAFNTGDNWTAGWTNFDPQNTQY